MIPIKFNASNTGGTYFLRKWPEVPQLGAIVNFSEDEDNRKWKVTAVYWLDRMALDKSGEPIIDKPYVIVTLDEA